MNESSTALKTAPTPAGRALAFRGARAGDLELIVRHRREMFAANGFPGDALATMSAAFRAWLAPRLASGAYFGWIVEDAAGQPVAGLGMIEIDWPPHPLHPGQDRRGYVLNVFVEPHLRGAGIARALMDRATDEGRRRGLDLLVLHASPMGRSLYEGLGWTASNEMLLPLAGGMTGP
jgi:ribosomal protein S18 acetylase RimI-like enzyme